MVMQIRLVQSWTGTLVRIGLPLYVTLKWLFLISAPRGFVCSLIGSCQKPCSWLVELTRGANWSEGKNSEVIHVLPFIWMWLPGRTVLPPTNFQLLMGDTEVFKSQSGDINFPVCSRSASGFPSPSQDVSCIVQKAAWNTSARRCLGSISPDSFWCGGPTVVLQES